MSTTKVSRKRKVDTVSTETKTPVLNKKPKDDSSRSVANPHNYIFFFTYAAKAQKEFAKKGIKVDIPKEYEPFSNYHKAPIKVYDNLYMWSEGYYQACKFVPNDKNQSHIEAIENAETASQTRELGTQRPSRGSKPHIMELIKKSKQDGVTIRDDWDTG